MAKRFLYVFVCHRVFRDAYTQSKEFSEFNDLSGLYMHKNVELRGCSCIEKVCDVNEFGKEREI